MDNFIKHIEICNFKSVKYLKLIDCRRINLFIGYPNVGKSNLIEALGLFSLPFLAEGDSLNKLVRAEHANELFYNAKESYFSVSANKRKITAFIDEDCIRYEDESFNFSSQLVLQSIVYGIERLKSNIKRYVFQANNRWQSSGKTCLTPPYGENLIDVISRNTNLLEFKTWLKKELSKYGLEYVLDKTTGSIKVQRRIENEEVMQLPFSSIADTLQRIIFYKTAIASNTDSILLFEEPEAHAFPPYIRTITADIAASRSNQFFIATHSPVIVNEFLEDAEIRRELAVYIIDFRNGETTARHLTDAELEQCYADGIDLFFDIERYLD
ncbi:MAG: AAA family ATPase [Tannerella sp.]|jgi:AAA15 family ATPase/GTPase|nr:AAA family ATPase [Tannerella sp.]